MALFKFWIHILTANHNTLLQQAYYSLLNQNPSNNYNWCSLLKAKINNLGFSYLWIAQSPDLISTLLLNIKNRLISLARQDDLTHIEISSHFHNYALINKVGKPSFLLKLHIPLHILHSLAQIRIHGYPISINNKFTLLSHSSFCKLCNNANNAIEDLYHIMITCSHYESLQLNTDYTNLGLPKLPLSFYIYFKNIPIDLVYAFFKVLSSFFKERTNSLNDYTI